MATNYELVRELSELTGQPFLPLPFLFESCLCYHDGCSEVAVVYVPMILYQDTHIQKCEGHARLTYDDDYQKLRLKWRKAGWGE